MMIPPMGIVPLPMKLVAVVMLDEADIAPTTSRALEAAVFPIATFPPNG
jgi:flagellar biosynthesis protein FliP